MQTAIAARGIIGKAEIMTRTPYDARNHASRYRIPLDRDFHSLDSDTVESILSAADEWKYRKPSRANGSRARYFHAYLRRLAARRAD